MASGGASLPTAKPLPPPNPSVGFPAPPSTLGNGNQLEIPGDGLLVSGIRLHRARRPLALQQHRGVLDRRGGSRAARAIPNRRQEAFLERLLVYELLDLRASLDEAGIGPVTGADRRIKLVLATLANREVGPPEHLRPGRRAAADRDRRDARCLELVDRSQEVLPRRRRLRDPGLREQVLVVPDADHAQVVRDAVLLALVLVHAHRAGIHRVRPVGDVGGDVLEHAGIDLLGHAAAAPRLEEVRNVAALELRRELRLERVVLEDGDVDGHVRVRGRELVGHRPARATCPGRCC